MTFDECWDGRITVLISELPVPVIGRNCLIRNKRASGRKRDLADLEALGEEG